MGINQLIMIIVSVILVGVAVAVGIYMFHRTAFISNRQAILAELEHINSLSKQYFKLPQTMGGAGSDIYECDTDQLASYLGFSQDDPSKIVQLEYKYFSDNGEFHLVSVADGKVEIAALGNNQLKGKFPFIISVYDLLTETTELEIKTASGFNDEDDQGD